MNCYDSNADDIFVDTKCKLCTISRPPQQAPGHISVVSSPFLLNNHVQLKVPRTTPVPKTGDIVLNIIKHVSPSPNQYEEVYPYSLKQSQNQGGLEIYGGNSRFHVLQRKSSSIKCCKVHKVIPIIYIPEIRTYFLIFFNF